MSKERLSETLYCNVRDMETKQSHEDLRTLLTILPPSIAESVEQAGNAEAAVRLASRNAPAFTPKWVDR